MTYLYLKALHIIFIVTWFSGMFYVVRLFIYNTEAQDKDVQAKLILQTQFAIMIKRLWLGITWPSAIITLVLGICLLNQIYWADWLLWKLFFVLGLYVYHITLHIIYKQQMNGIFKYTSQQLRLWNEVATIFLVGIVFIALLKNAWSAFYGIAVLGLFTILLLLAIRIYKKSRK